MYICRCWVFEPAVCSPLVWAAFVFSRITPCGSCTNIYSFNALFSDVSLKEYQPFELAGQLRMELSPESTLKLRGGPGDPWYIPDFLQTARRSIAAALGRNIRRMKCINNRAVFFLPLLTVIVSFSPFPAAFSSLPFPCTFWIGLCIFFFSLPFVFLFLSHTTRLPTCLLVFHVASFYVRTLIITLFCTSNPSSCPARSQSTALWFMGLWRTPISLPAPLSLRLATRSKVCWWIFPPCLFLVIFLLSSCSWNIFGMKTSRVAVSSNRRGGTFPPVEHLTMCC